MKRREVIKSLALATGGLIALPAWARGWNVTAISAYHSVFSADEKITIQFIADTIIPEGDAVGAVSVGTDTFLCKLFSECYTTEVQKNIKTQIKNLNNAAIANYKTAFGDCSLTERKQLFLSLESSEDEEKRSFFNLLKSETIRGFSTSQTVMIQYHKYDLMPGHYDGCVDVETA